MVQTIAEENIKLKAENALLEKRVVLLEQKVLDLLKIIEQSKIKKDSHNSHNPPSQDKAKPKKKRSLRPKTNKKPGGQPGHEGRTLLQKETADQTHELKVEKCEECATNLKNKPQALISKRQVVELPPILPIYVEYQQYGCLCDCGHHQKAVYPKGVNAPIQYGPSVVALVSYLNVFQYIPYARLRLFFSDIFTLPISEGSIENLLNKAAQKAQPVYDGILKQIKEATYVGSDETGAKVNGEKWWIWVWQNVKNTFLKASKSRGYETVEAIFPNGLPNATVVSDRLAAQLKIASKGKQICIPHLLRELIFLEELEEINWATSFKNLLKKALELRNTAEELNIAYDDGEFEAQQLEDELNTLLAQLIDKKDFPLTCTFQKSMVKNRNKLFIFLYDLEIPPDNNGSERALRNVKVKQKISGQFKSGQDTFCVLRSVVDTLRKRQLNVLDFLSRIMAL